MKLLSFPAIAAAFLVVVACKKNDSKQDIQTFISIKDSLCAIPLTRSVGEFIKMDEAYGKLERYKRYKESNATTANPYDRKKDIYGFVFGIDKLRELIQKMDDVNLRSGKDSLIAVRVYFARTGTSREIPDVFMIPVAADKNNIYPIDPDYHESPLLEVPMILNTSVPCPNKCDSK